MSINGFIKRTIFWTKDFFAGRKVGKHFDDLKKSFYNVDIGKHLQEKKLNAILEYATTFSPFYQQYAGGGYSLKQFPVVNKTILTENFERVAVPVDYIPEQETKNIHIQKTSGSTGTPFCIPQDSRKRYRRIAELKFFGELVGFKSHEKLGQCRIWTKWHSKSKKQAFWENIIPINIDKMDDRAVHCLFETVKKEKIVSLRAYASWYDKIVQYLEDGKGNPKDLRRVKVAISSSEALQERTREKMKELTGIAIVECYADEEGGILAHQQQNDTNYYLNHASYYFEFLKMDSDEPAEYGEVARIVFTDLYNYAFPLIRYDTGDTGILLPGSTNKNSYGWDYMSKLYGRRLDLIYDTVGNPVSPMNFARILKNIEGIVQWQFIQKTQDTYVLKLNVRSDVEENFIIDELKNVVGENAQVSIEYIDEIPVLASGKRRSVICEWKKDT